MGSKIADELSGLRGRISRRVFWRDTTLVWLVFWILRGVAVATLGDSGTLLLIPPLLWVLFALCAKRYHDQGHAHARLLMLLVPVLGPLWVGAELALRRGTAGQNVYGEDTRRLRFDYQVVALPTYPPFRGASSHVEARTVDQ